MFSMADAMSMVYADKMSDFLLDLIQPGHPLVFSIFIHYLEWFLVREILTLVIVVIFI